MFDAFLDGRCMVHNLPWLSMPLKSELPKQPVITQCSAPALHDNTNNSYKGDPDFCVSFHTLGRTIKPNQ